MSWHLGRLAAFDIETTGTDTEHDRIVTASIGLVGAAQPTVRRAWLVDPGVEIPAEATAVHGISTMRARAEGIAPAQAVEEIVEVLAVQVRLGVPVVAFNARFDLTILDREARRHGIAPLVDRVGGIEAMLVIDPHVLDKQIDRYRRGKRTLSVVCEHYDVRLDGPHDADADAIAAARVAYRVGQRTLELQSVTIRQLHAHQVAWADEQARSLQEYFEREGRGERVEGAWPMVPQRRPGLAA